MARDYTPNIPKAELKHGAYYNGRCRNASIARWDQVDNCFHYWRTKFGSTFLEGIRCPEDETDFDVFVTESEITDLTDIKEIPLRKELGT
jgi:hypothetical protein